MRGLAKTLIVVLVLGGLFSYLVLPGVIEDQLGKRLQVAFGAPTQPDVDVSSDFPPELLVGRIDRIQVHVNQGNLQGVALYNTRMDLKGVNVNVPSLLEGAPIVQSESCSLSIEVPSVLIEENQVCLNYMGLGSV
jgi:LmeA-like phospholipid-binding